MDTKLWSHARGISAAGLLGPTSSAIQTETTGVTQPRGGMLERSKMTSKRSKLKKKMPIFKICKNSQAAFVTQQPFK